MTSKEALNKLQVGCLTIWEFEECIKAIQKDLDAYEELKGMHEELAIAYNKLCEEKMDWLKQKEILEIIKKKRVNLQMLCSIDWVEHYNLEIPIHRKNDELTETEFNLIKEWLENESR